MPRSRRNISTHIHPPMMSIYEMGADLTRVESIGQLQKRLQAAADQDNSSNWVMGYQHIRVEPTICAGKEIYKA